MGLKIQYEQFIIMQCCKRRNQLHTRFEELSNNELIRTAIKIILHNCLIKHGKKRLKIIVIPISQWEVTEF